MIFYHPIIILSPTPHIFSLRSEKSGLRTILAPIGEGGIFVENTDDGSVCYEIRLQEEYHGKMHSQGKNYDAPAGGYW